MVCLWLHAYTTPDASVVKKGSMPGKNTGRRTATYSTSMYECSLRSPYHSIAWANQENTCRSGRALHMYYVGRRKVSQSQLVL